MLRIFLFSHHRNICTRRKKVLSSPVWWQNVRFVSSVRQGIERVWISRATRKESCAAHFCLSICYQLSVKRTKRLSNMFERGPIILSSCLLIDSCFDVHVEAKFNEQRKIAVKFTEMSLVVSEEKSFPPASFPPATFHYTRNGKSFISGWKMT